MFSFTDTASNLRYTFMRVYVLYVLYVYCDYFFIFCTFIFTGEVQGGLLVNSDREHLIYPLGNTIVVEEIKEDRKEEAGVGVKKKYSTSPEDPKWRQKLLSGHRGAVSCLAVSKSGKYLASGEKTHMGFQADVIIWDFECGTIMHTLYPQLHKVKVEAMAFSPNDKYLVSLGGQDDRW